MWPAVTAWMKVERGLGMVKEKALCGTRWGAALYARVSTTGHGQDVGLQLDELRQVAQARGWSVVAEFVDEGISGTKATRPGLDTIIQTVRLGRVDVVAFWLLDRLGRSLSHVAKPEKK